VPDSTVSFLWLYFKHTLNYLIIRIHSDILSGLNICVLQCILAMCWMFGSFIMTL